MVNRLLCNVRILASACLCFHMMTILSVCQQQTPILDGQQGQEAECVRIKSAACFPCAFSSYKAEFQLLCNPTSENSYRILRSVVQLYV